MAEAGRADLFVVDAPVSGGTIKAADGTLTIFASGTIVCFQCMQTYIVDSYTTYAASGVAAAVVLRSLAGFGFPLFAPAMFNALDFGWGNSLLAFIGIVLGVPAPLMLWKFGELLRSKSQFAAGN